MNDSEPLGDWIRRQRELHRWSQPDLAKRLGVSVRTISNWERGNNDPRNSLAALRQVFGEEPEGPDILPPGVEPVGDPSENLFRVSMSGVFGVQDVIVSGPIQDADLVREQAAKLIAMIRRDAGVVRESDA